MSKQPNTTTSNNSEKKRYFFFDLDDCLYPRSSGVDIYVRQRISQYMRELLGIENADEMSQNLYITHGTTVRGLIAEGYKVDPLEFYHYCHSGFDIDKLLLKDDSELISLLTKIKKNVDKMIIFTNSDSQHANRVLTHLGIKHLFDEFVCYEDLELSVKPHRHAFEIACEKAGLPTISSTENQHSLSWRELIDEGRLEIYFVDDNIRNIKSAIEMGWNACWISENGVKPLPEDEIPFTTTVKQIHHVWDHLFNNQ
ncbi:hypothetical protein ABK040_000129 [Willaertia magna]